MKELVSVYIPTHNRQQRIVGAIESVLQQSYANIEIIVVDDGSSDNTQEILTPYINQGKITYLKNDTPMGACHARNRAINIAKGDYITGLDDDDRFTKDRVAQLMADFDPRFSFVCSSLIEEKGKQTIKRANDIGVITANDLLHYNKAGNQVFTLTERLKAIGGFDESLPAFQDHDCWLRLTQQFGPGIKVDVPSYRLNTSDDNIRISSSNSRRLTGLTLFKEKHLSLMTSSHIASMAFLKCHIEQSPLTVKKVFSIINRHNWRRVVALFLKQRLPAVKRILKKLRKQKP